MAAILWIMIPPLQGFLAISLIEGVISQEIGRYAYYQLCAAAERRVAVSNLNLKNVFCPIFNSAAHCEVIVFPRLHFESALTPFKFLNITVDKLLLLYSLQALSSQKLFSPNNFDSILARLAAELSACRPSEAGCTRPCRPSPP